MYVTTFSTVDRRLMMLHFQNVCGHSMYRCRLMRHFHGHMVIQETLLVSDWFQLGSSMLSFCNLCNLSSVLPSIISRDDECFTSFRWLFCGKFLLFVFVVSLCPRFSTIHLLHGSHYVVFFILYCSYV